MNLCLSLGTGSMQIDDGGQGTDGTKEGLT